MRHRIAGRQLNRTSEHRLAMRRNLVSSLFEHETISTTMEKAKEVKPFAEKLITRQAGTSGPPAGALLNDRRSQGKDDHQSRAVTISSGNSDRGMDRPGGYRISGFRGGVDDNGSWFCCNWLVRRVD